MFARRAAAVSAITLSLAACVPTERVAFTAGPQQQAVVRDGRNTIMSKRKNSTVIVSPASREIAREPGPSSLWPSRTTERSRATSG